MISVHVRHRFDTTDIDLSLELPGTGVTAIFGPSGAGKSVLIQAIAGLFRPDACRIAMGEKILADTRKKIWQPPEQRRLGLVFQDSRLFPHMTVETNLRFGQRRTRAPVITDFADVIALLAIAPLLRRRPHTLSGGERQRVAIGRALLSQPDLLLMDEPLASLDLARRDEILPYLGRLAGRFGIPILYVTHAIDEVIALADHVVLLRAGRVLASGPLADITNRSNLPLAQRDDAAAILTCTVASHDPARGLTALAGAGAPILIPLVPHPVDSTLRLRIPARDVIVGKPSAAAIADDISLHNILPGIVRAITPDIAGDACVVELSLGPQTLLARITPDAVSRLALAPGGAAVALIKSVAIEVVGDAGQQAVLF